MPNDNIFDEQTIPFILDSIANKENVIPREIYMDYENNQAYLRVEEGEDIPIGKKVIEDLVNDFIEKIRDGCSENFNTFGKLEAILEDLNKFIEKMNKVDFVKIDGLKEVLFTLEGIADSEDFKALLNKKVDKIEGKGLTTNNYTEEFDTKLDGIEKNANKFIHTIDPMCNITAPVLSVNDQTGTIRITKDDLGLSGVEDGAGPYIHPSTIQCNIKTAKDLKTERLDVVIGVFDGIMGNNYFKTPDFDLTAYNITTPKSPGDRNVLNYTKDYKTVSENEVSNLSFSKDKYWTYRRAFEYIEKIDAAGKFNSIKKVITKQIEIKKYKATIRYIGADSNILMMSILKGSSGAYNRRYHTSEGGIHEYTFKNGEIVRAEALTRDTRYYTQVKTINGADIYFDFNLYPVDNFIVYFKLMYNGREIRPNSSSNLELFSNETIPSKNIGVSEIEGVSRLFARIPYPPFNIKHKVYSFSIKKFRPHFDDIYQGTSIKTVTYDFKRFKKDYVILTFDLSRKTETEGNQYTVRLISNFITSASNTFVDLEYERPSRNLLGLYDLSKRSKITDDGAIIGMVRTTNKSRPHFYFKAKFNYKGEVYATEWRYATNLEGYSIIQLSIDNDCLDDIINDYDYDPRNPEAGITFKIYIRSNNTNSSYNKFEILSTNAYSGYSEYMGVERNSNINDGMACSLVFKSINILLKIRVSSRYSSEQAQIINSWVVSKISDTVYKLVGTIRENEYQPPTPPPPAIKKYTVGIRFSNVKHKAWVRMATELLSGNTSNYKYGHWYGTYLSSPDVYWYPIEVEHGDTVQFKVGDASEMASIIPVGEGEYTIRKTIYSDRVVIDHRFSSSYTPPSKRMCKVKFNTNYNGLVYVQLLPGSTTPTPGVNQYDGFMRWHTGPNFEYTFELEEGTRATFNIGIGFHGRQKQATVVSTVSYPYSTVNHNFSDASEYNYIPSASSDEVRIFLELADITADYVHYKIGKTGSYGMMRDSRRDVTRNSSNEYGTLHDAVPVYAGRRVYIGNALIGGSGSIRNSIRVTYQNGAGGTSYSYTGQTDDLRSYAGGDYTIRLYSSQFH